MAEQDVAQPPQPLDDAAAAAGLGARQRVVKSKRLSKAGRYWPVVLAAIVGALLLPSGSYAAAMIVLGAGLGVSIALQVAHDQTVDRWLAVHDGGVVYADKSGLIAARWEDIASVQRMDVRHYRNGVYTGTTHKTVLGCRAGVITVNDKFREVESVSDQIQSQVTKVQLPLVVDAVNAGQTVSFGSFSLDGNGIGYKGQVLTWDRAVRIKVDKGNMRITEQGQKKPWATAKAFGMPNYPVFLTVAQALGATIG